jgi:hypothetical protein
MALSIARVARALQFQGDFILLRQLNFGMASLELIGSPACHRSQISDRWAAE